MGRKHFLTRSPRPSSARYSEVLSFTCSCSLLSFLLIACCFSFSAVGVGRVEDREGFRPPFICLKGERFGFFLVSIAAIVLCWEMEGKKGSFVDEYFPQREEAVPSKSDILSSIFPPQSPDAVTDSAHDELLPVRARKKGIEGLSSTEKIGASGGSFHISQTKNQDGLKKNADPIMPCEIAEPCLMSSSVYYGGRDDFIPENSSSYRSGSTYNNMKDNEDASNPGLANRGEWWQGSFYY